MKSSLGLGGGGPIGSAIEWITNALGNLVGVLRVKLYGATTSDGSDAGLVVVASGSSYTKVNDQAVGTSKTTIATFDVLGKVELSVEVQNVGANPFTEFEILARVSGNDAETYVVLADGSTLASGNLDFDAAEGILNMSGIFVTATGAASGSDVDFTTLDDGTTGTAESAVFKMDVAGYDSITVKGNADPDTTADIYGSAV